jgi:hypothetical protein
VPVEGIGLERIRLEGDTVPAQPLLPSFELPIDLALTATALYEALNATPVPMPTP